VAADIEEAALGDRRLIDRRHWKLHFGKRRRVGDGRNKRDKSDAQSWAQTWQQTYHDILPTHKKNNVFDLP
jgi:hypothetical protein